MLYLYRLHANEIPCGFCYRVAAVKPPYLPVKPPVRPLRMLDHPTVLSSLFVSSGSPMSIGENSGHDRFQHQSATRTGQTTVVGSIREHPRFLVRIPTYHMGRHVNRLDQHATSFLSTKGLDDNTRYVDAKHHTRQNTKKGSCATWGGWQRLTPENRERDFLVPALWARKTTT